MGDYGLAPIHNIINNVIDQDERIWRQTAAKKCLKKEIEKIEEKSQHYEKQIAILKKYPLHKERENVTKSLKDNMKEHLQIHKLLSLTLRAKNEEIERKTKDIESWDKKYKEVISELKEAYEIKKNLYETVNPMFKKLAEIDAAQKAAEVKLKQLKASSERRQRSQKQLKLIKKEIFQKTIVNFSKAVIRKKKYDEVSRRMKVLGKKKKEMVQQMFEAQENLKKRRVSHTSITSGMFTRRIPNLNMQQGMINRNEKRKLPEFLPEFKKLKKANIDKTDYNQVEKNKISDDSNLEEENTPPVALLTPKKNLLPSTNQINIHSNKTIALPPLKTILTKQRSRLDTSNRSFGDISFNRSQNSQVNSQTESIKKVDTTPKSSQERQAEKNQNVQKNPIQENIINITKPPDYLKNLKFTTQSNKFDVQKKPSFANIQNSQTQKASILKSQTSKRKVNESIQDVDLDTSQRKKEKNVNFASPIQQQMEINQISSPEMPSILSSSISLPSNVDINPSLDRNMWASTSNENNDGFQIGSPNFSFAPSSDTQPEKNGSDMPQASMFGSNNNGGTSFGFLFGGSSKASDGIWDLFA